MLTYLFKQLFDFEAEATPGERIFNRVLETAIVFFSLLYIWQWATYIARLFKVVLPLGLANYMDVSLMFNDWAPYLLAVIASVLALLGFMRKWKYAYLLVVFLFHVQYTARFSQGEISHGSNLVGMCLLVLALSQLFFYKSLIRERFTKGMILFFTGWSYFSAAVCKLIGTGPHWVDGHHLWLWLGERRTDVLSQFGAFENNFLQTLIIDNYWVATLILCFGILAEALGALIWFKKTRIIGGILLIGMHFGILVSMNINFDTYIYILALIAFPWARWINKIMNARSASKVVMDIERN